MNLNKLLFLTFSLVLCAQAAFANQSSLPADEALAAFDQIKAGIPTNTAAQLLASTLVNAQKSGSAVMQNLSVAHEEIDGTDYYTLSVDFFPREMPRDIGPDDVQPEPVQIRAEVHFLKGHVYVFNFAVERIMMMRTYPGVSMGSR